MLLLQEASSAGWEAAGHAEHLGWIELVARGGVLLLGVALVVLVARAGLRRRRYRVTEALTDADRERVHEAIRDVESRTVGEVLPVVLERSDRHPGACWIAALLFVFVGSALLGGYLPWSQPALLLLAQLALGGAGYGIARLFPDFARLFVSADRATEVAEEQAFQEFYVHGLHETEARTGILIFVSLLEHRVVVLADRGIDREVDQARWTATRDAILAGIQRGSLTDGLVEGVRAAGEVLAEHFPWEEGDRDEIPNRLIVRRE